MTSKAIERSRPHLPAGAPPSALNFEQLLRRAEILARSGLVPTALKDNPEGIALVGMRGAELGFTLGYSLENIDPIEGKAVPNAQARLALLRRHGHEVRFTESTSERATIRGRRQEYRNDPDAWVTVTFTIEDARRAELTAMWVEHKYRNQGDRYDRTEKHVVGDDRGLDDEIVAKAPDWAKTEVDAGRVKTKDNWRKDPTSMLRARAATHLCRMEFSDVMAGLGVEPYTLEEIPADEDDEPGQPGPHIPDDEPEEPSEPPAKTAPTDDDEIVLCCAGVEGCTIETPHDHEEATETEEPSTLDPTAWDADQWRERLRERDVKHAPVLREARRLAGERGEDLPSSIDDIAGQELGRDVWAYVEALG